jgi:hypothetical protein
MESGKLNEEDRLDLCRVLAKAGYIVAIERRKYKSQYEYVVVGYERKETNK